MTYTFTLIIDATFEGAYPDAEDVWMNTIGDVLFERYEGDATPCIRAGMPCVSYSVDAPSMEAALRDAVTYLEHKGHHVLHVEIKRDEVSA